MSVPAPCGERPRAGIVLAAGQGRRMGGPKAMLRLDGRATLTEQHLRRFHEVGCERLVAVVPPASLDALRAELENLGAEVGEHGLRLLGAVTTSPAESLQVAMDALAPWSDLPRATLAVTPVDLLPPAVATLGRLFDAVEASRGQLLAATPVFEGKGGHPVVLRSEVLGSRASAPAQPLRDRLRALGHRRLRVAVGDRSVLGDFDRPTDLPV